MKSTNLNSGLLRVSQLLLSLSESDLEIGLLAVALGLPLVVLGQVALLLLNLGEQSLLLLNDHLVLSEQSHLQLRTLVQPKGNL